MTNINTSDEREAGVRANDSSLLRIFDLHKADGGGVDAAVMFVEADETANATIEVYAEVNLDVGFYLLGYWSTAPANYTELFEDIGSPSTDNTWEDTDLSNFCIPSYAVVEFALVNQKLDQENTMGVRRDGSSQARLLNLHEAKDGGEEIGRMQVPTDYNCTIEFRHQDVSDPHAFIMTGFWRIGPELFLYWKMDECSGDTVADASDASHDGTLEPDEATGPQWTARGWICHALDFDATNDSVSAGALTEPNSSCALTVSVWVRPVTLGQLRTVVSKFDSAMETGWTMETGDATSGGSDDVRIALSATDYAYTTGDILSTETWAHWSFVYDGQGATNADRLKFYLNGSAQALTFVGTIPSTVPNTTHDVLVGATSDGASYFDGIIDELRIYVIALTAPQVLELASEAEYDITDLGTLPAPDDDPSLAIGINSNAEYAIAGFTEDDNDDEIAWFWKNSTFTNLGTLGGTTSVGRDVNDAEQLIGRADLASGVTHAFLWDSVNGLTDLGTLGGRDESEALGINASGEIAGTSFDTATPYKNFRAFLWTPDVPNGITGSMPDLGTFGGTNSIAQDLNDSVEVVGGAQFTNGDYHPFVWDSGSGLTDLGTLGGSSNLHTHRAQAINTSGQIAGMSYTATNEAHAFLWTSGAADGVPTNPEMKDLGTLGGDFSQALGLDDDGWVVGRSTDSSEDYHAFLWRDENMFDLNEKIDVNSTWVLKATTDINDDGNIVGWGTNPSSQGRAFLLIPNRECACGGGGGGMPRVVFSDGTDAYQPDDRQTYTTLPDNPYEQELSEAEPVPPPPAPPPFCGFGIVEYLCVMLSGLMLMRQRLW